MGCQHLDSGREFENSRWGGNCQPCQILFFFSRTATSYSRRQLQKLLKKKSIGKKKMFCKEKNCSRTEGDSFAVASDRSPCPGINVKAFALHLPRPPKKCNPPQTQCNYSTNIIQIQHKYNANTVQGETQIHKYINTMQLHKQFANT